MTTGHRVDPYGNFNFLVEIDGISRAAFQECNGFDSTIDVIEHREGGDNIALRKLPAWPSGRSCSYVRNGAGSRRESTTARWAGPRCCMNCLCPR